MKLKALGSGSSGNVVIPCYHLVWYNREHKSPRTTGIRGDFI